MTGNGTYKTFGDLWRYDHYWGMFNGKTPLDPAQFHAYSHVNTLSSAAMTYAVTGESQYLQTIVNAHDHFQEVQCYATGGYGPAERLVAPDGELGRSLEREANTFETPCGAWAVFKLGRYLIEFTGEARYGDWMEKLLYNGIGAALPMAAGGKTFYYSDYLLGSDTPIASARKDYYWDPYPCCSGTYIQAVADYHNIIYFHGDRSLCVNLFVPSTAAWNLDGHEIQIEQETAYPESETVVLTVRPKTSVSFPASVPSARMVAGGDGECKRQQPRRAGPSRVVGHHRPDVESGRSRHDSDTDAAALCADRQTAPTTGGLDVRPLSLGPGWALYPAINPYGERGGSLEIHRPRGEATALPGSRPEAEYLHAGMGRVHALLPDGARIPLSDVCRSYRLMRVFGGEHAALPL